MKSAAAVARLAFLRLLHYLLLAAIAVMVLVPFAWMLSTSLKGRGVLQEIPPRWIPEQAFWSNYRDVLVRHHFLRYGLNSIYVSLMGAAGQLFTCSLAGFAFARLRFWGREVFFALLLATMMIPLQVMIIPEFLIMMGLGWIDHPLFLALIVPSWLAGSFGTFMLRQFFLTVPKDLEDAGRIDGCSIFGIYWKIFLPLSVPALATLFIFAVMSSWNDLLRPILYLSSQKRMTLTIGLAAFTRQYDINAQRYFVQGITLSGLKG